MRSRDLLILCLLLAFGASVGIVLWTGGDPEGLPSLTVAGTTEGPDDPPAGPSQPAQPDAAQGGAVVVTAASDGGEGQPRTDTTGWTRGVVAGDIQLAVSVLDRLDSIQVMVKELRGALRTGGEYKAPWQTTVPVIRGRGTPTFVVKGIPFSPYPYAVSVYAPGLNGSRSTVVIDEKTPLHEDVLLRITPGAPFTILVRDQDMNPHVGTDVRILPVGDPPGRREHLGQTDSFGSVVFEDVLCGDYQLVSAQQGQQLADPVTISVQPGAQLYGTKVQGQAYTLMVPRGVALEVLVADRTGYGIPQAKVELQPLDTVRPKGLEGATDDIGRFSFQHVTPGRWMLRIQKEGFEASTRPLTIADGVPPDRQDIRLTRRD